MDIQELLMRESRTNIENWCRSRAQNAAMGDSVLCRVLGKYLMYVPNTDRSIAPHLILDGYWEMWITMAVARYVREGMVCVDVGANVGYYSVLLTDIVGPKGHVYAVEPVTTLALRANLEKVGGSGCSNWTVVDAAASEQSGYANLTCFRQYLGDCSLQPSTASLHPGDTTKTMNVKTVKLDDLVTGPVDFIKIDVEGHEPAVWRGARELIARSPKVQIAAEWTRHYDPGAQIVVLAQEDGFVPHEVRTDGGIKRVTLDEVRTGEPTWRMLWLSRTPR